MRGRKNFLAHRIIDDPGKDFILLPATHRDRSAEVRDAVEIIHRAVERIDDPLELARLIATDAFLAVDRVVREACEEDPRDEVLRLHVECQLDVVRRELVDLAFGKKVFLQELARRARRFGGGFQIDRHGSSVREKNQGEKTEFSRPERLMVVWQVLRNRSKNYFFLAAVFLAGAAALAAGLAAAFAGAFFAAIFLAGAFFTAALGAAVVVFLAGAFFVGISLNPLSAASCGAICCMKRMCAPHVVAVIRLDLSVNNILQKMGKYFHQRSG